MSEPGAFNYLDRVTADFLDDLEETGFYEDGIVVVVSDHRTMTPLTRWETQTYGYQRAPARVPLAIKGAGIENGEISDAFQQLDVVASIKNMVAGQHCRSDWQGEMLREPLHSPRYIVHRRGDRRDMLSAYVGDEDLGIKLDGDNTHVTEGRSVEGADAVVDYINRMRIRAAQQPADF